MCLLLFPDDLTVLLLFKGDYDVVINDYEKAKSLFGKTEVQVFKKCKIFFVVVTSRPFLCCFKKDVGCIFYKECCLHLRSRLCGAVFKM